MSITIRVKIEVEIVLDIIPERQKGIAEENDETWSTEEGDDYNVKIIRDRNNRDNVLPENVTITEAPCIEITAEAIAEAFNEHWRRENPEN
jgi:hypothetical protein